MVIRLNGFFHYCDLNYEHPRKNKSDSLVIRICVPQECTADDLRSFARFVRQGEQVTSEGLETRIAEAAWLGFALFNRRVVGVAAIKNPQPNYQFKVFSAAEVPARIREFTLEFGWVFILPEYRSLGIATSLLQELLAKVSADGIFATTGSENRHMHQTLLRSGFQVVGQPFKSTRKETTNFLWVRSSSSNPEVLRDAEGVLQMGDRE